MILRLVYSFFFFSLVTGNQRFEEESAKTARMGECRNKICICQDHLNLAKGPPYPSPFKVSELPLRVVKGHYGYPAHGMISANPVQSINPSTRLETKSFGMEYVSDDSPSHQVPVKYVEDESENKEKTICFTPTMVHKLIKAALEYVSQMPSDINNIIDKLDKELNRMSDPETIEDNAVKKPLYPLDSKTVFQMLDKPRSEKRTNVVLKYELPSVKEPHCREVLEKLIEVAYTASKELEKHPQCRDYLYNYASHQPADRPAGRLDQEPDLKSLVASILDEVDKRHPNIDNSPGSDRYGEMPNSELPTPQTHNEHNIPQIHEYDNHQKPREYNIYKYSVLDPQEYNGPKVKEYNIHKYNVLDPQENNGPKLTEFMNINKYDPPSEYIKPEYNLPKVQEYNIHKYSVLDPQENNGPKVKEYIIPEYNVLDPQENNDPKVKEYIIPKYNVLDPQENNGPKVKEYIIPKYGVPETQEYNGPKVTEFMNINKYDPQSEYIKPEYNVPEVREYNIPEYNAPKIKEYTITQKEYIVPKIVEYSVIPSDYNIPQSQDIVMPQVQTIDDPEIHETIPESIEEIIPMQPEETMNTLKKLLQTNDDPDSGNLFDRLMKTMEENQSNFHPKIFKILLNLLSTHKKNKVPRFNDIFLLLLDSQRNRDWPWNGRLTEHILSHLIPDPTGNLDPRIVDIILNLYKTRPNEKHIEHILSLLRPIKEGNVDPRISDLILKLINLYLNNLLRPEYIDILLKLLKPAQNGISIPKEVDIVDNISRSKELAISPNQLNGLFALLKPYANGHTDHRPVDIVHYLLTQGRHLNPKHLDFILSFLYPENGILDTRHVDIIKFLVDKVQKYPKHVNNLLGLLEDDADGVLNSRFLDVLLFLDSNGLLTPELTETLINLLNSEITGQLDDNQIKTLFFQLAPFKQSNPKLVADVLTLLNQGGLRGDIVEWLEKTNNNVGLPNRDSNPGNIKVVLEEVPRTQDSTQYRTPDGGYSTMDSAQQLPDHDFVSIFKWLDSQGLLTPDQGSNADLVNKVMKILEEGQNELGVVELTYMLKHEKPLIYQPVYYVKYRLPILSFISNMKTLLMENPDLNADPMKLLQELIVTSNVTEVSPNLQGYPKEEILKLTFNDGDLVQAKILDEQNLSLNDQIKYVHGLNSDISPEEILELNRMNEAKYFSNLQEVKGVHPDKLTIKEVDKFIDVPAVQYRNIELQPAVAYTKTKQHSPYVARANQIQNALPHNNALPRPVN